MNVPFGIDFFKVLLDALEATLDDYVGKDIKDICDTGFDASNHNHCAHFVSHAMGIKVGMVCGSMKYDTRGEGASIRVNEVYNAAATRGLWSAKPASMKLGLAYVTLPTNVSSNQMGEHPRKHIGVFIREQIWHYSNGADEVVKHGPTAWHTLFKGVYGASTQMYYSSLEIR